MKEETKIGPDERDECRRGAAVISIPLSDRVSHKIPDPLPSDDIVAR